jgi:hypothetical protein
MALEAERLSILDGAQVVALPLDGEGGLLSAAADTLRIEGSTLGSVSLGGSAPGDRAADIAITARDIALSAGGRVISQTLGGGDSGAIAVTGFENLVIDGAGAGLETAIETEVGVGRAATGSAGALLIEGGSLLLRDGGRINATTFGAGDAGAATIRVDSIEADGGGQITAFANDPVDPNAPPTTGSAGELRITVRDGVVLRGARPGIDGPEPEPSGFFVGSEGRLAGGGGALVLTTPSLFLGDGAEIGAESFGVSDAGAIMIATGTLTMRGGSEIATTSRSSGAAGPLTIALTDALDVAGGSEIASRASGVLGPGGRAGVVRVTVSDGDARISEGSVLTTNSADTDGGAVFLSVAGLTLLDGGAITTSVSASDGDGGAINTAGEALVLRGDARIQANAVAGDGGLVTIGNALSITEAGAVIEADSLTGDDGQVLFSGVVGAQTVEVEALSTEFFDAFALVEDPCVAVVAGGSAFTRARLAGRPPTGATQPPLFGGAIPYPAPILAGDPPARIGGPSPAAPPSPCVMR